VPRCSRSLRVADRPTAPDAADLQNRSGVVIAIRGLFVFLYNRDISTHNASAAEGVFVVNPRTLISAASKTARIATDLTKLNPEISQHVPAGSGVALQGRKFRDPLQDMPVVIVKGINKSRVGLIKDVNGEVCRVELQSTNQTVTVNKSALKRKECVPWLLTPKTTGADHCPWSSSAREPARRLSCLHRRRR
jgi:transcription elongation factor